MREVGIGGAARASGVHVETIRYYERIGLVAAPPRSAAGQRRYGPVELRRLRFVRRARELGFSLDEIRALLALAAGGHACAEVRDLAQRHLGEIRRKIADLERMEATLAATVALCAGDTAPHCPILDTLAGAAPVAAG
jgi:MerR family mercuric resistance operon transcriptional regulator